MAILRRVVDPNEPCLSREAARDILRLDFSKRDGRRMNHLAAKNRRGELTAEEVEHPEMENAMVTGLSSQEQADSPVAATDVRFNYDEAFSRNIGLFTLEEQDKLRRSHVAIAGMGGVGGVHLITLARTGIGNFTIADPDRFELANMNRQYGARVDTIGRSKVEVMAEGVRRINPEAIVRALNEPIGASPRCRRARARLS